MMDDVDWSEDSYPLPRIIDTLELPCVVQIAFGYYGEMEMDSFSTGDLIRIDTCIDLRELRVQDVNGESAQQTYTLSVDSNCKLKVRVGRELYNSVSDLIHSFPRFVKTLDSITVPEYLPAGTVLELCDGGFPEQRSDSTWLRCKYLNRYISLSSELKSRFITEPDPSEYTLKSFLNRYNLPQIIETRNNGGHRRVLKAIRIEGVRNVMGYYKSVNTDSSNEIQKRALFCLNVQSTLAHNTEIKLPVYNDVDTYQITIDRIFPSKQIDPSGVDTTIYIEYRKNSPLCFFDETKSSEHRPPACSRPKPPPIPKSKVPSKDGELQPPPVPARDTEYYSGFASPKCPSQDDSIGCIAEMLGGWNSHVSASESDLSSLKSSPRWKKVVPVKHVFAKKFSAVNHLIKPAKPKICHVPPMQKPKEVKATGSVPEMDEYIKPACVKPPDYIDPMVEKLCPEVPLPSKIKKKKNLKELLLRFGKGSTDSHDKTPVSRTPIKGNFTPRFGYTGKTALDEVAPPKKPSFPPSEDPVLPDKSSQNTAPMPDASNPFSSYSIREVSQLLLQGGMKRLAQICLEESIDGNFLYNTESAHLKSEPFNLNDFDIMKLHRLKSGWRPKR